MRKLITLQHCSLDMFMAGPKGEMDWIRIHPALFDDGKNLTDHADAALYARKTWQMMEAYWPTAVKKENPSQHDRDHAAWYRNSEKYVVSNSMQAGTAHSGKTTFLAGDIPTQVKALKSQPGNNILMYGSPSLLHLLTQEGLIDEYHLCINPVLLGNGIPVFPQLQERLPLAFREQRVFENGVMKAIYQKA